MIDPLMLVGKRVAWYRRDARMTQVQLAKRVGCTKDAISRIERGVASKVALRTIFEIAQAFKIGIEMLLTDTKQHRRDRETDRKRAHLLAEVSAALRRRTNREIEAALNVIREFLYALGTRGRPPVHRQRRQEQRDARVQRMRANIDRLLRSHPRE